MTFYDILVTSYWSQSFRIAICPLQVGYDELGSPFSTRSTESEPRDAPGTSLAEESNLDNLVIP